MQLNNGITSQDQNQSATTVTPTDSSIVNTLNERLNAIERRNILLFPNDKQLHQQFPNYVIKDDPKPAVFIARKLLSDFVQQVQVKIELILAQETKDKPIFKALQYNEDSNYDQILEAVGAISEFCLPSLISTLLEWYHYQLDTEENLQKKSRNDHNAQPNSIFEQQDLCLSPNSTAISDSFLASSSSTILRSPTPSSSDNTNQVSITSTLPLEYQSPSLTVVETHSSSAPNTSTSTATNVSSNSLLEDSTNTRKLLIEYAFCQVIIKIFNQLHLHPGHEDLIGQIEDIAFDHFRYIEGIEATTEAANVISLAEKFAEVIGVLAQTRFKSVKKRFMSELNELKSKDPTLHNIQCIVTLLSGMKFFRVKMAPIEDFEASFQFLQECSDYFLEVRHKSIKHALAGLFVEILVPLASIVKNEVKIPCLKNFVDTLWAQTLDMCARKKHSITLFPLVTCLLCVSQRAFFLTNWGVFLNMCLSNLKNRDQKMCRIALDSLYRLIWIYMIRVKCESNNITQARLHSIVDALFPRGSKTVVPREAPLSIFIQIIQFIAQERLDFAMRHIIFELLAVERSSKVIIAPERMSIGLQAFLIIAENLQQKEGDPSMPKSLSIVSALESIGNVGGSIICSRKGQAQKMLSDDLAKSIGIYPYSTHIQKSFNDILKALDTQYGRPLLLTTTHHNNKEPDDIITSERKPKIDFFKCCIIAIPRLMPDGMSKVDLIDLLSRLTVHVDEGMRKCAFESLQTLTTDFVDWRMDVVEGFTSFLVNQIDESLKHLVDNALRMLLQLLISWRDAITPRHNSNLNGHDSTPGRYSSTVSIQTGYETISSRHNGTGGQIAARKHRALTEMRLIQSELSNTRFDKLVNVMQKVEGAALIMLCNYHQPTRRLAAHLLRESRSIVKSYSSWTCMEQFGFKSPEEVDEDDLSASLRGSLSADNLSRITALSNNGPIHSSVTSMNPQAMLSTSVSKTCISITTTTQQQHQSQHHQHDPYDSDIENDLADCFTTDENSSLIFWFAVMMLESEVDQEYATALRLTKKILPDLPFEQQEFVEELEKNLRSMEWKNFPGLHALILKGCSSSSNYEISVALLDHLTPILKHPVCSGQLAENVFPFHVIVLMTYLLSNYEDPNSFSLNIARRIAIWCDENSQKLENLATVMNLYSRRSFSKDGFQWIKCVVKYLHDAYPRILPTVIPLLVDMLENGPLHIQRLIAPILYCILNYVDMNAQPNEFFNYDLMRIYNHYLNGPTNQWRDAVQIFKLIISRSSYLVTKGSGHGRELPGRTMEFAIDVELIPVIAKSRTPENTAVENSLQNTSVEQQETDSSNKTPSCCSPETLVRNMDHHKFANKEHQMTAEQQAKRRKSWLAHKHIRERLVKLLI